jgi:hypothetical protein
MLPDPGCYEERYRLNGRAALGLAAGLLSVGLGILWHTPVIFTAIALLIAIPAVIALARRMSVSAITKLSSEGRAAIT